MCSPFVFIQEYQTVYWSRMNIIISYLSFKLLILWTLLTLPIILMKHQTFCRWKSVLWSIVAVEKDIISLLERLELDLIHSTFVGTKLASFMCCPYNTHAHPGLMSCEINRNFFDGKASDYGLEKSHFWFALLCAGP